MKSKTYERVYPIRMTKEMAIKARKLKLNVADICRKALDKAIDRERKHAL